MKIEVVNSDQRFNSMKDEWNSLLDRSINKAFFMRWEWMYYWWITYKVRNFDLQIVLFINDGKIRGIAPLYLKKNAGFIKKLCMLGTNEVCSDHLDFIIEEGQEDIAIKTILSYIKNLRGWDILDITNLQENTKILGYCKKVFKKNVIEVNQKYTVCRYINLEQTWNNIIENINPRLKNTIKRKENKLKKLKGNIEFTADDENQEIDEKYLQFVKLAISRHSVKKIQSPYKNQKFLEFHRKLAKEIYDQGMVKIIYLKINDEIIAGIYLFIYNNKILYYQSGFLPEWKKLSPGSLLFYHCIKIGFENKKNEFDFLQGDEEYKMDWTNSKRNNIRITIYKNNYKAAILYSAEFTKIKVKKLLMKVK